MNLSPELIGIIASAIALGALMVTLFISIRSDHNEFRAEVAADRRAFQAGMDEFRRDMNEFRREMRRLAERQSHLEGVQEAQASTSTAGS